MSKITNDCLTRSGTGCFIAVPIVPYGNSGRQCQRVNVKSIVYYNMVKSYRPCARYITVLQYVQKRMAYKRDGRGRKGCTLPSQIPQSAPDYVTVK